MYEYSDPQTERLLRKFSLVRGFNVWLDVNLVAAGNGQTEITAAIRPEMQQHHGFVHGGIVGTLADTASSWAAATIAGDVVTSSYTVQFLAPAIGTLLRATATTIKAGKRNATVEAKVFAEQEGQEPKLVAVSLASIAILSPPAEDKGTP